MKKFHVAGLLAFCLMALSQQSASAWVNKRFSMGLSWEKQSGGNSALWGAWVNGQPPGPEQFNGYPPPYLAPYYGGAAPYHAPPMAPFYAPHHHHASHGMPAMEPAYAQPTFPDATPFQFATYPRPAYFYYGQ